MTQSMTPYRDAALRVIEAGKIAEAADKERTPAAVVGSRLRLATVGPLLLALADEIDAGTDRDDLESAIINVFANLACSAAGFVRGGAMDTNGTAFSILSAARALITTFPDDAPDMGPVEIIDAPDVGGARMNALGGFLLLVGVMAAIFAVTVAAASCDDLGDTPPERLADRGGRIAGAMAAALIAVSLAYIGGRFG